MIAACGLTCTGFRLDRRWVFHHLSTVAARTIWLAKIIATPLNSATFGGVLPLLFLTTFIRHPHPVRA